MTLTILQFVWAEKGKKSVRNTNLLGTYILHTKRIEIGRLGIHLDPQKNFEKFEYLRYTYLPIYLLDPKIRYL